MILSNVTNNHAIYPKNWDLIGNAVPNQLFAHISYRPLYNI